MALSVGHGYNIRHRTYLDLSASGPVRLLDALGPQDGGRRGKIRSLDDGKQLLDGCLPVFLHLIVDDLYHRRDHFPQIMGRDIGCHSDGNSGSSVYQQIRESGRKHHRLLFRFVKVWHKVHRVLINIRQHFRRDLT